MPGPRHIARRARACAARCALACLVLGLAAPSAAQHGGRAGDVAPAAPYEPALSALLDALVTDTGSVRYALLRGRLQPAFRQVLKAVEEYDPARLRTPPARLAYWLNAYNVQMLAHLAARPDVRDVLADGNGERFFKHPYRTARQAVSLDEIEHVILRGQDGAPALRGLRLARLDPRIHVGLNCAAVSCPPLQRQAFTPANVDSLLDAAMRRFTASPAHLRAEGDGFVLSALLDWFGEDFEAGGRRLGDYLLTYMPAGRPGYDRLRALLQGRSAADLRGDPRVRYAYDWTVNRAAE